jgi:hypothetical protein
MPMKQGFAEVYDPQGREKTTFSALGAGLGLLALGRMEAVQDREFGQEEERENRGDAEHLGTTDMTNHEQPPPV